MTNDQPKCELCGEPMPAGEEMFKYHGYSGNCPKPPKAMTNESTDYAELVKELGGWSAGKSDDSKRMTWLMHKSASVIDILQRERDEARAERDNFKAEYLEWQGIAQNETKRAEVAEAEVARLREANGILEDALQEVGDDYPGSSCQEWCQQQVKLARAALEAKP